MEFRKYQHIERFGTSEVEFDVVDKLSDSDRGAGGYGSSGK